MHNFQLTFVCLALITFNSSFGHPPVHTKPPNDSPFTSNSPTSTTITTTDSTTTQPESTLDTSTEGSTEESSVSESSSPDLSTTPNIVPKDEHHHENSDSSKSIHVWIWGTLAILAMLAVVIYIILRRRGSYTVKEQCIPVNPTVYFGNTSYQLAAA